MTDRRADTEIGKLIHVVTKAQARDAEDEHRLPFRSDRPVVRRRRKKLQYWAQGYIR
jgi:hypothetical protein